MSKKNNQISIRMKIAFLALGIYLIFQTVEGYALDFFRPLPLWGYWLIYGYVCVMACLGAFTILKSKQHKNEVDTYFENKLKYDSFLECLDLLRMAINNIILKDDTVAINDNIKKGACTAVYLLRSHTEFKDEDFLNDVINRVNNNLACYNTYINDESNASKFKDSEQYLIGDLEHLIHLLRTTKINY